MTIPLDDPSRHPALAAAIARLIGADEVAVEDAERLAGGGSRDGWRLDVLVKGGRYAGAHRWRLDTAPAPRLSISLDRTSETKVLHVAHEAGVRIAGPIATGEFPGAPGQAFVLHRLAAGSPLVAHGMLDSAHGVHGPALVQALAGDLAKVHATTPQSARLSCLPIPAQAPARALVARLREALGKSGEPRPALEYVLAWLDAKAPPARGLVLVHGDFRTSNAMADAERLTAILGWQFAHWGDPDEDIGCFTARCSRAGNDALAAGGLAPLATFLEAYEAASGRKVAADALRYWQIMAAARRAASAVLQGDRFRIGGEARLELALAGLAPAEFEHDALADILAWTRANGGPWWQA